MKKLIYYWRNIRRTKKRNIYIDMISITKKTNLLLLLPVYIFKSYNNGTKTKKGIDIAQQYK